MKNIIAMILSLILTATAVAQTNQTSGRRNVSRQRIKAVPTPVSAFELLISNDVQPDDLYTYPSEFWAHGTYFDRNTGELLVATSRDLDLEEAKRKGVVSQDATSETGKIGGNEFVIERLMVTDVSVNPDNGDVQFSAPNGSIVIHAMGDDLLQVTIAPAEDTFDFHAMRFQIRVTPESNQKEAASSKTNLFVLRFSVMAIPTICKCDKKGCGTGCTDDNCDVFKTCTACGSCGWLPRAF